MQSPKRVLQVLIPPNVAVQKIQKESELMENKMKIILMGLEIERLHKVANIITDKYEDKLQQLETQQQLLNDKIDNQDVKIGSLNQQLLLKDDFINEVFDEKCPDEVNKKLNQQLKQVTSQLNRAKKQIETLDEMYIIFKKNPPESPEIAQKILQLENNYEEIIQKKDQEITNLKIRNSSYDHSQEFSDQKTELLKLQHENQFLNEKIENLIEENEKLKQQLIQSVKESLQSIPEYKLVTQVIQQEPFHAFTDFQLLGRNDGQLSSQVSFQPQKTPIQNNSEIMKYLKNFEKIQTEGQFTHEKVLQQVRICATLLHLKRMELPEDINDSNIVYLNKIEKTDTKIKSKQDLASTIKPKKLFIKHDEPLTQEKQLRSQSLQQHAQEVQFKNQFVQVDFKDKKQLEETQQQFENLKNDYYQLSKIVNEKLKNESIPGNKLKESLNKVNERISDYSFRESQIQQNKDKINSQNLQKQIDNLEEQVQYLKQQNQQQQNLIKKLQGKNQDLPNGEQKLIDELKNQIQCLNEQLSKQRLNTNNKVRVLHKYNQTEIDINVQQLNDLDFKAQFTQMQEEMNDLKALNDHLLQQQQNQLELQNQIQDLKAQLQKQEDNQLMEFQMQMEMKNQIEEFRLENGQQQKCQNQIQELNAIQYSLQKENADLLKKLNNPTNDSGELLNQVDSLQRLLEQTKLELYQKHLDLDQLENEKEFLQKQIGDLKNENENLQQIIKDQENEYQSQLSQIKYRISILEGQQVKEHSRSISVSDDQNKEQQTETILNPDYEIQLLRLQDEKALLYSELQKQIQESKQKIKSIEDEFAFQRLQLEERIEELQRKLILYQDGDAQLMLENQNLANQITTLTTQLTLIKQQSKVQSSKTLKSTLPSPREQATNQEIIDLRRNLTDLQFKISAIENEKMELESQNNNLNHQLLQLKTEGNFEQEDNKRLKSQNLGLRDQIQILNKQIIMIQKNTKQEIDCLNIQLKASTQKALTQNKKTQGHDKQTQIDYVIDQRIFQERDTMIIQLKKLIHKKDIEFDEVQQNLLISRQEIFRLTDQIRKLNSIRLMEQTESQRKYDECALYPQRGRANSYQIVRTVSEDKNSQQKVQFWQKKYEQILKDKYSIKPSEDYKIKYEEILNKQKLTQQELDNCQQQILKYKQMIEQLQINIFENKQQYLMQNNEQILKKDLEIQQSKQELNQLRINLDNTQQELYKQKIYYENQQNQQKTQIRQEEIQTYTLEIFKLNQDIKRQQDLNLERENQVKYYQNEINQNKYEIDQLRIQIQQLQNEKSELLLNRQTNSDQQNIINKLDDRCHLLLTELNMLRGEYKSLEMNYKIETKQQDNQFNRFEIMHNLDIIKQELRAYQSKCQIQEQEINQLRFQIHLPVQKSSDQLKEQYQYLGEILKELEVTKLQNENLRKQNQELSDFQNKLSKENETLKKINSPINSPRIRIDQYQQNKQEEIDELRFELDQLKRQVLNSSTQVKEAETLSLQARVHTLEQKLIQELENFQLLKQENQDLRQQIEQMKFQQRVIDKQTDFNQTEKLNRDLSEKISELTQLKIKYKQALQVMQRLGMMNIQQNKV